MRTRQTTRGRPAARDTGREPGSPRGGRPLDPGVRGRLEPRMGHSFAEVRIHEGAEAQRLAADHQARAMTVGNDIYFGPDQYQPATLEGEWRVAHELAHTVQQSATAAQGGIEDDLPVDPDAGLESRARGAGLQAALGIEAPATADLGQTTGLAVQREDDPPYPTSLWDVLTDDVIGGAIDFAGAAGKGGKWAEPLGGGLGILSAFGGGMDIYENVTEKGTFGLDNLVDTTRGGLNIFSGLTSTAGALGWLPSVAGSTSLGAIGTAGAGSIAAAGGQVAAAGLAGYGAGRLLDEGVGGLMNITGASDWIDSMRGISRGEGQQGDYSISGMGADIMTAGDQAVTGGMRALGLYDESKPAYTQTLGWQLGEILPSWLQ